MGAALLTLFLDFDQPAGYVTILLSHIAFEVSFIAMTVRARVRGFDWTLEDASLDLGAGPARTFFKVTLPLAMPADHLSPGDRVGVYLPGRAEPVVASARFRGGDEDASGRSVARITLRDNDIGAILRQMGVDGPTHGGFVLVRHG